MVIEIVEDATKACFTRKDDINLHKLGIKLMLPEYNGSDTLETFLHFVKEATKSLSLVKILREDMGLQTDLLGQMLKGKAQTWYNHMIGNNTNQEISLSEAMITMKRYFIKDASSRDAAVKFDRLRQSNCTVAELFRELECLTQQMVETPSSYDLKCRFMNALNREMAMEVTCLGYNPENHTMAELLQAARQVEQSQFYIEREDQESLKQIKPKSLRNLNSKPTGSKPRSYTGKPESKEPFRGSNTQNTGKMNYHNDKKTGYGPFKMYLTNKAARAARDVKEDVPMERIVETQKESEESSDIDRGNILEDNTSNDNEDSEYESLPDEEDDGLANWAAAIWTIDDDGDLSSEAEYEIGHSASVRVIEGDSSMPTLRTSRAEESSSDQVAFRNRATKDLRTEDGPARNFKNPGVMEGFIRIGEIKAHVLLDCSSTLDMVSANYATMSKLDMFQLKKPVRLQMATSGSCTTIQFGARAEIRFGEICQKRYFDIINLDRYNAILGIPFLKDNEVLMNFSGMGSFRLAGQWFQVGSKELRHSSFKEGEGTEASSKNKKEVSRKRPK